MKVTAGIVLYNPDLKRLEENLDSVCRQADQIVCIDNGSADTEGFLQLLKKYKNVSLIANGKNLGIAEALNEIFQFAIENNSDWVLTLDQDSVCEEGLVSAYSQYTDDSQIGMMTCVIVDRNIQTEEFGSLNQRQPIEVEHCITSGAFCSVDAYNHTPGFDSKLFIDWVDYDYSAALRTAGYKIYRIPYEGLIHELGKGDTKRILGKEITVLNESEFRVYHRFRNKIVVCNRYPHIYGKRRAFKSTLKEFISLLLYEDQKIKKVKAGLKGIMDARKMMHN